MTLLFCYANTLGNYWRKQQTFVELNKQKWDTDSNETDGLDTKESSDDEDKPIKSKYLHKFSMFRFSPIKYFLMEMNYIAREEFKWTATFFDSPHGLSNRYNTSSAGDIAKMSSMWMKNASFAKVVKTKRYKCHSQQGEDSKVNNTGEEFQPNHYIWENTNRMLWRGGYDGLKTGITPTAGPCLAWSYYCDVTEEHYIIVILNAKSADHRWNEVSKLRAWTTARMRKIKRSSVFEENPEWQKRILTKIKHL
jgi:hypothetical protein